MGFDHLVYFCHNANRFAQGDDDLLVVGDVVFRERAAFAVFEPFITDLVSANVKVPHGLRHASKPSGLRLVEPHGVVGIGYFLDLGFGRARVPIFEFVENRRF